MFNLLFVLLLPILSMAQQDPAVDPAQVQTEQINLNTMSVQDIESLKSNENITEVQKQQIDTYLQIRELQDALGVTPESIEKFQSFVDKWLLPYKDKILIIASDKNVTDSLKELIKTGNFKLYIILQVLLIFFMIFLRAKESSKISGFTSWLWLNTWTFVVFMAVGLIVIPMISFGAIYKDFIWALVNATKAL